jgi:hypothetical protein
MFAESFGFGLQLALIEKVGGSLRRISATSVVNWVGISFFPLQSPSIYWINPKLQLKTSS